MRFVVLTPTLPVALILLSAPAAAADLTFTGSLRFVSASNITVRLSNGIVIDARLPKTGEFTAEKIPAQYKFADQVQIACKNIQSAWDDPVKRYHSLELTRIHFLRAPTTEEAAQVSASLSWQPGDNLLEPIPETPKPARSKDPEELGRVREVNLARAAKMPSFVADEAATRSLRGKGETKWKQVDTVESEIAFHGDDPARQHIRINGKPYTTVSGWIPGVNWGFGFGDDLKSLLNPDCANTFELAGREELRGKQVAVYRFHSPLDGCFGPGTEGFRQYDPAQTGRILIDDDNGSVLQIEKQDLGTPPEWGGTQVIYSWDYVKIGEASHLLPIATDFVWTPPNGSTWHVAAQYKNHRHFESSADVTFHP
jgi:hypothetical protein